MKLLKWKKQCLTAEDIENKLMSCLNCRLLLLYCCRRRRRNRTVANNLSVVLETEKDDDDDYIFAFDRVKWHLSAFKITLNSSWKEIDEDDVVLRLEMDDLTKMN